MTNSMNRAALVLCVALVGVLCVAASCPVKRHMETPAQEYVRTDVEFAALMVAWIEAQIAEEEAEGDLSASDAAAMRANLASWKFKVETAKQEVLGANEGGRFHGED